MARVKFIGVLALLSGAGVSTVGAAELGFMGAAGLQFKQLTMEQTFSGVDSQELSAGNAGDLTATLPALTLQGIIFYDAFYAALKIESGLSTEGVESDIPFTTAGTNLSTDVGRDDFSLSVGYKVWQDLSVFGGYMSGKTELTPETGTCAGTCPNIASQMADDTRREYRQEYEEQGVFFGASYGWEIGPGRLGTSLAYALMDGQYTDNFIADGGSQEFDYQGDSKGLSAAVTWSAPINERFGYFVDGRLQSYSMDASDETGIEVFRQSSVETEEQLLGVTAGVQAFF